jgi:hypothetical protein
MGPGYYSAKQLIQHHLRPRDSWFDTGATYPEFSRTISFQYEDILAVVRGSHTFKFGGLYFRHRVNGYSAYATRGSCTINGQFASRSAAPARSRLWGISL